jgi:tRNA-2-methylthio-N6-dimethylallyladenosine synthase
MTDDLITTMATLPKCPREINLPVQAGHDTMLKRMRRGYTVQRYRELIAKIRTAMPDVSLSTDIIVGHPGETDEEFPRYQRFTRRNSFRQSTYCGIFGHGLAPGLAPWKKTRAMAIPDGLKQFRRIDLERQQEVIATERSARLYDQIVEVLVEGESKGKWRGRTTGNVLVFFASPDDWRGRLRARPHHGDEPMVVARDSMW